VHESEDYGHLHNQNCNKRDNPSGILPWQHDAAL